MFAIIKKLINKLFVSTQSEDEIKVKGNGAEETKNLV